MTVFVLSGLILISTTTEAGQPDYGDAIEHAKNAFLIQSGIQHNLDMTGNWAKEQVSKLGFDKEIGAGYFVYKAYKTQSINFPIGHDRRVGITTNSANISFPIIWY